MLDRSGRDVWVYDNLSKGHRGAALDGRLIVGDLMDRQLLDSVFKEKQIDAVMHFAASIAVGESVEQPAAYYRNNVVGTLSLLDAMRSADVGRIVFSSTAAIYGKPSEVPITERAEQRPINPYGFTKLIIERALADYAHAYGWGYAALRYFNAAGASRTGDIGEDHNPETHLIPIVLQVALGQRDHVLVFGDDYPTGDGTCVRDYIHVEDLVTAHLAALERLESGTELKLNLGTGQGASVREVIEACRRVTGHPIPAKMSERRAGDPPMLVADASLARKTLDWQPEYMDVESIVESAWRWHQSHPNGFGEESRRV
jgi:UDP-glucose-4-epimerase GalE